MRNTTKKVIFVVVLAGVFLVLMVMMFVNRTLISDTLRGLFYHPSDEMISIREELKLTDDGVRVFNASFPVLNERNEFNERCESHDSNIYILGCYTAGGIYVYNIADDRFDGIREVTSAHELLHAVYARMSDSEKISLSVLLEEVYRGHNKTLGKELAIYDGTERYDELHSRIGTEIKDLPEELEKHYAKVFQDQDYIVSLYEKYSTPLCELKETFERLETELTSLKEEIETKKTKYETEVGSFNKEVAEFNNCAGTVGCYANDYDFRVKREELVARKNILDGLHLEITELVGKYNGKVEEYNQNIEKNEALTAVINSNAKKEKIEETDEK